MGAVEEMGSRAVEYFLPKEDAERVEAAAIDEGSSPSQAVYVATMAMHKANGSLVREGFAFLEGSDVETEAFLVSNGAVVPKFASKASRIAREASAKEAAMFEPLDGGPVSRLFSDPEGVVLFRCVDAPGLELDAVGRALLESSAALSAPARAAPVAAPTPSPTLQEAHAPIVWDEPADPAREAIERLAERERATLPPVYFDRDGVEAFAKASPKSASNPEWRRYLREDGPLQYEAARAWARDNGSLLCEGELLMRHGGEQAHSMLAFALKDGAIVPSNWEMSGELAMVATGFNGADDGIFFKAPGFSRVGIPATMDPAERSHYRILEGPGLELSPLGEALLALQAAEVGSLSERIAQAASAGGDPRPPAQPGEPDPDAFWVANSHLGLAEFQKAYFEQSLARAKAAGTVLAQGEVEIEELDGSKRRVAAYVEESGRLRAQDLSAAAATGRLAMGFGAMAWFESPAFPGHKGLVFCDPDTLFLVAGETPGAKLSPNHRDALAEIKAFLGEASAPSLAAPQSAVERGAPAAEAAPVHAGPPYEEMLESSQAQGACLAVGVFRAARGDGTLVASMDAFALSDGTLVGRDPETMREVAHLHECAPQRFYSKAGFGITFAPAGGSDPCWAFVSDSKSGSFKALEAPGAILTDSETASLAELRELKSHMRAAAKKPGPR